MYHKLVGGNQSFSSQMEIMNDRSIVVLENKSKVVDFLVFFVAIRLRVIKSIAGSIFTKLSAFYYALHNALRGLSFIAYANNR